MPKNVQIRNVDDATYEVLRRRAAADDLSLAQYLRRELHHLAAVRTMQEILAEADQWRAAGNGISREEILRALDEGRTERG